MISEADMLKTSEAALVAEVELRDVHRLIDEQILPQGFVGTNGLRRVQALACPLIAFYFETADRLTAAERRSAIVTITPRLSLIASRGGRSDDLRLRDDYLTIDFNPFFARAERNLARLGAARDAIESDPHVLGGTPVLKGTRVPVHDVAASLEAGLNEDRILEAYPSLTPEMLDLCVLYAQANPLRGRPRREGRVAPGAVVIEDIAVKRRGAAG
ncbi:DUF433 domain-containing protein [Salinarimonas sp.]|uniref:DUF433 domain-containing protein n=1 Tax=Salinarimonas sp. TaxID=2766526 RepID=UPI00391A34CE